MDDFDQQVLCLTCGQTPSLTCRAHYVEERKELRAVIKQQWEEVAAAKEEIERLKSCAVHKEGGNEEGPCGECIACLRLRIEDDALFPDREMIRVIRDSIPEPFKSAPSPAAGLQSYITSLTRTIAAAERIYSLGAAHAGEIHPVERSLQIWCRECGKHYDIEPVCGPARILCPNGDLITELPPGICYGQNNAGITVGGCSVCTMKPTTRTIVAGART
jgi:hypothetical protein